MKRWIISWAVGCSVAVSGLSLLEDNITLGHFEIGGEAIWLRASVCDLDFCIADRREFPGADVAAVLDQRARLPVGQVGCVDPDYEMGYRINIAYVVDSECTDAALVFTHLNGKRGAECRPDPSTGSIWPTFGHPHFLSQALFNPIGTVVTQFDAVSRARASWDCDSVDIQLGSRTPYGFKSHRRLFFAVQWAEIDHRFVVEYDGTANPGINLPASDLFAQALETEIDSTCKVWGVGGRLGFEGRYGSWCGFGIATKAGVGALAGQRGGRMLQNGSITVDGGTATQGIELDVQYCRKGVIFAQVDARLGLNYEFWCDCWGFVLEAGYEITSYINALGRPTFGDTGLVEGVGASEVVFAGNAIQNDNCYSFNLDGLYLMAKLIF